MLGKDLWSEAATAGRCVEAVVAAGEELGTLDAGQVDDGAGVRSEAV